MKYLIKNKNWNIPEDYYNIDKILYLLIDRPHYINHWNDFIWEDRKRQYHRNYNLPAIVIIPSYTIVWYLYNLSYRKK